ncbi:hypothetical protein [Brevundimonas diminuta]|uniref:hypothetical protein n=1 Tax=Brevundimonas diminuta TaxID=293 RepID=UPI0025A668B2|nr:hypothetical protein [Brevundimonas diminuta]MDM8352898.1 hypothetical protein [Brevundimonas diminuta]
MLEVKERLWAVADELYEVLSSGAVSAKGEVPPGLVDMAGDGTNVVLTVNGAIYYWNATDGLTLVEDEDAPAASSVEWMNGFYLFTERDTEQFFVSPQGDPGGDWDALDFDSSDIVPDDLVRIRRVGRTLLLFGRQSVEFWFYSGDAVFPFNRYSDDPLDVGLAGVRAEASTNETVFWLANDGTVRRLDGRTATRISTFAVEDAISKWTDRSLTVTTSHVWQGHLFVVFRNPDGCVVWDQATSLWHERQSYDMPTWRVAHYARAHDKHLFGGDKIYEHVGHDEDGNPLPFEMIFPWLDRQGERFSVNEVELRVEAGVGSLTLDPALTLSRTEDGEEWTAPLLRRFGKQGERVRRVVFSRQGMSRGCAFKLRITDPVKRVVLSAYAEVD